MAKKQSDLLKSHPHEFRFSLGAFSKDAFPMGILAEYLHDLAIIYGQQEQLHFIRLEKGSTVAVARALPEAEPEIENQLVLIQANQAPSEVMEAVERVDRRLRSHHTRGFIAAPSGAKILKFPGIDKKVVEPIAYGPFNQHGTLEGVPIMIGGKDERVPVHLEDWRGNQHICYARRSLAKEIAPHLFTSNIRVEGTGRWLRHANGEWEMKKFTALDFSVVPLTDLGDDIERLRSLAGKWKELPDPIGDMDIIRHDGEIQ